VYPDACGRWHNFFTVAGGDPYVLDDTLGDSMEGDRTRDFQDVPVWRWPGTNIGHGRSNWFRRKNFVAGVRDVLETHLYWPGAM
jgi:hypothetical protein